MRGNTLPAIWASILTAASALCAAPAEAGLIIGTFAFPSSNTVAVHEESDTFGMLSATLAFERPSGALSNLYLEASPHALKVKVDSTGEGRGGYTAFSGNVRFDMPGAAPGTTTTVTLQSDVSGMFETISGNPGMRYFVTMNLGGGGSANFSEGNDGDSLVLVADTVSITRTVRVNESVPFFVIFRVGVYAPFLHDNGVADFANSLTFNPDEFFVLQPGVTANSVGADWLVNNRLPEASSAVPEPSSLTLFGLGAVGLVVSRLRGRRRRRA